MPTSNLAPPMELLGSHPGISVIDPATVLTRLWYFDGKFLRAEGFRRDQEYVRSLVALSNQAVGNGVVHGFDVRLAASDTFAIEVGLALAPSGRVIYLPSDTELSISRLIARSDGSFDPGEAHEPGVSMFAPCPPDAPDDGDLPVPSRPLYVLTVAAADALCGEEERFGQLCEDACATDTDRSVAVEGVRFRVRELSLALPTSRTVPFSGIHLRSRVASAYFEAERRAIASMISGAGLRSAVWCSGADAVGGEEVPLAVFDRSGTVTSFADQWIARRELIETNPHRYWQWRCAMRPLDVFLAQVLQFQCQLVGAISNGDGGQEDPCADERRALGQVQATLSALADRATADVAEVASIEPAAREAPIVSKAVIARLGELQHLIAGVLSARPTSVSGSLLVDRGIVETPSGFYLPIDPGRDLRAQVRALIGPGVDLRFCAVRPDFVPEALQEAQHMERISLTRGLDDPSAIEEADVLVPGGTVTTRSPDTTGFLGRLTYLPARQAAAAGSTTNVPTGGSSIALEAVARDQTTDGWSWSLAARGEAPHRLVVGDLATAFSKVGGAQFAAEATPTVFVERAEAHEEALAEEEAAARAAEEAAKARLRRDLVGEARRSGREAFVAAEPTAPDRRRAVVAWFDVATDQPLEQLPIGGHTALRLQATAYAVASTTPVLADVVVSATATVTSRQTVPASGGTTQLVITTRLDGVADPLIVIDGNTVLSGPRQTKGLELRWLAVEQPGGMRILAVSRPNDRRVRVGAAFADRASPRHVSAVIGAFATGIEIDQLGEQFRDIDLGPWEPIVDSAFGFPILRLIEAELDEVPDALALGGRGHDIGDVAIDVIAGELAARNRDDRFAARARERLFGTTGAENLDIVSDAGWVMVHRRRVKRCSDAEVVRPTAVRRFRWYHTTRVRERSELAGAARGTVRIEEVGGRRVPVRERRSFVGLGFEPVAIVEFEVGAVDLHSSIAALRTAWSTRQRGSVLTGAAIATAGPGEGAAVNLARLRAALAAVGDLIDIDATEIDDPITEVPPEFEGVDIDGVILSAGVDPIVADETCAVVVRVGKQTAGRLRELLQGTDRPIDLSDLTADEPDRVVARFVGDELDNTAEVVEWGQDLEPAAPPIVIVRPGEDPAPWDGIRREILVEVLGIERGDGVHERATDVDCQAVVVIEEGRE